MTVRTFTPEELRRTGSLKWTGQTKKDGSATIGAWVAEMDFATAPVVADALKGAIDNGLLGYQPPWLARACEDATAEFQKRRFGWDIDADEIRLVNSVLSALEATIEHFVRPASPVIVPTPAYMPFLTIPGKFDHPVIETPSLHGEEADGKRWALDLEGIRAGLEAGAGLVVLCNPWNPTGRVFTEAELRALNEIVRGYDAYVFSDEIHSPLVHAPAPFISYARLGPEFAAHTITATAASKGWNIAGLPSAQVILPDDALRERWDGLDEEMRAHASVLGTVASITAYQQGDPWQAEVLDLVRGNIDMVERALAGSSIDFTRPESTYLTWWGFGATRIGDAPADHLRERAAVATNDGRTLGTGYESWVRVNLACAQDVVEEILARTLALVED